MTAARSVHASPWLRVGNRLGSALLKMGLGSPHLDAETLIQKARRTHDLHDFGPPRLHAPLRKLLDSLEREAQLSPFGYLATRWDMLRLLGNRLRLQQAFDRNPTIADESLTAPIIITGLPRSGSTFLHRLLAQDPLNRVPRHYETLFPVAPEHGRDRRRTRVERQLAAVRRLAPALASVHPLTVNTPQECTELFSASFVSLRFDTTFEIPGYRAWLDRHGAAPTYCFQRRVLQYLQSSGDGDRTRWVLKSPDHVFTLPELLHEHPNARLIITHRDPLKVISSVARLTVVLRSLFNDAVEPMAIGRTVADRWAEGARRLTEQPVLATRSGAALDVQYRDIARDPLGVVGRIYRHFGLTLTQPALTAMRRFVAAHRDGDYGHNPHQLDHYGLGAAELRRRFEDYVTAFAPTLEHPAWRGWRRRNFAYELRKTA